MRAQCFNTQMYAVYCPHYLYFRIVVRFPAFARCEYGEFFDPDRPTSLDELFVAASPYENA